jgi:hypothetical protein
MDERRRVFERLQQLQVLPLLPPPLLLLILLLIPICRRETSGSSAVCGRRSCLHQLPLPPPVFALAATRLLSWPLQQQAQAQSLQ